MCPIPNIKLSCSVCSDKYKIDKRSLTRGFIDKTILSKKKYAKMCKFTQSKITK